MNQQAQASLPEATVGKGLIYEVPENLKYEEKILWGFTWKQLLVFSVFAVVAAIIFTKLGSIGLQFRIGGAGVALALGLAFATFEPLQETLAKRARFVITSKKGSWSNGETLRQFIRIKTIEGGTVRLQDGRLAAVLMVTPIDFNALSEEQKMVLLAGYRSFLNSLWFPIQIVVRTTRLNLKEYFSAAKAQAAGKGDRKALSEIEAFEEFVEDYVAKKGVHDRLFYIVIPQEPCSSKEEAEKQLGYKVATCKEKLVSTGLACRQLDENQLVSLYASFLGTHVATEADYLSLVTLLDLSMEERKKLEIAQEKFNALNQPEAIASEAIN